MGLALQGPDRWCDLPPLGIEGRMRLAYPERPCGVKCEMPAIDRPPLATCEHSRLGN